MASDFFSQYPRLILFSSIASILLSVWCVWADPIVNNDGVYYLRAAENIRLGNWEEAISIYSWPFYPAFIGYLSKYLGIEVVSAAYVFNAFLCVLLVIGFLAVTHELGGQRDTLIIAALVILAFPTLNKFRPFIIRDIGYVALYLWSLAYLFRYWRLRHFRDILRWLLFTGIAILFRVEGVALLFVVPILIFSLDRVYSRYRWLILIACIVASVLLIFLLALWLGRHAAIVGSTEGVADPAEIWGRIFSYISSEVGDKLELIKDHLAGRYYFIVYILIIVFVTLAEVVRRLAIVYALVAWWGWRQGLLFPNRGLKRLWLALILVNVLILIGSAIFKSIVVDRYALATTVTVLLACPFVFAYLWRRWKEKEMTGRMKWGAASVAVICLLLAVKGLDVFTDKKYLYQAGRWVAENASDDSALHSNNLILVYYSGMDAYNKHDRYSWLYTHRLIKRKEWEQYDYLAIELRLSDISRMEWLEKHLRSKPIKTFSNHSGDSVVIFRTDA